MKFASARNLLIIPLQINAVDRLCVSFVSFGVFEEAVVVWLHEDNCMHGGELPQELLQRVLVLIVEA